MDESQAASDPSAAARDRPNASPFAQRTRKALVRRHSSKAGEDKVEVKPRDEVVEQSTEMNSRLADEKTEILPATTDNSLGSKDSDTPIRRRGDGNTKRREGLIQRLTEKKRPSSAIKERPIEEVEHCNIVSDEKPEVAVINEKATSRGVGRRLQRLGQWKRSHSSSKQLSETKEVSMTTSAQESTGLDFRPVSVSDLGEEVRPPEASWDANKVYFSEFDDGKKKESSGVDMFEANVVTEADVSFDMVQRMNLAHPSFGDSLPEEKKEKDIPSVSDADELDPLGWPLRPEGLQSPLQRVEFSETVDSEDPVVSDDDGDNLLGGRSRSVDDGDHDELVLSGDQVTKEERIAMYERRDGDSSSIDDEGVEDLTDDVSVNEDVEVGYVSQESDDEKQDLDFTSFDSSSFPLSFESVPAAQFDAQPKQDVQLKEGLPPRSSPFSAFPPPPPPPPARKKSSKRSKSKSSGKGIPLLAPPPPEKLKKWEERKTRHISDTSPELSPLPGNAKERTIYDNNATSKEGIAIQFQASNTPTPSVESSPGTSLAPASSSVVIQDTKLAEKVDQAISAAAQKFEEHISHSPPRPGHNEIPSSGAFSPWRNKEGDSASSGRDDCGASEQARSLSSDNDDVGGTDTGIEVVMKKEKPMSSFPTVTRKIKRYLRVPQGSPNPFETAVEADPTCLSHILACLGDPVAVSRVKMLNRACKRYVETNEYPLMRDAVRTGGMSMNVRPYFWLWVTLEKGKDPNVNRKANRPRGQSSSNVNSDLAVLERIGREGPWHSVIGRDVSRAFGNLPPHKTGARLRTDSIVRALVTWGKSRIMKRGVKGEGDAPPPSRSPSADSEEVSLSPTDTVSDWGGVAPVGSFTSSISDGVDSDDAGGSKTKHSSQRPRRRRADEDLALSGNTLTDEAKAALQRKLSFILHALAAAHQDVGYCQGMDYVVAHLLRILQETILWKAANGTLHTGEAVRDTPPSDDALLRLYEEFDSRMVVEETCFRVMDSFFTTYGLQHFFWPELRCLKTCCLVFEKLIQIKLPVLADHFEHHELNVGLFALGWFQTLFLYLPSMPSATVCHMWDIWLVERSFKIFFRVGTAILFLSQPILLNHELEGMMSYLNTFPDATLLSPDILIACALQIKITNSLLMKVEQEVTSQQPGS